MNGLKRTRPSICFLQEIHFRPKGTHRQKLREWKRIFHANGNETKVGVAILNIRENFKTKIVTREKEGHYMIGGTIQE